MRANRLEYFVIGAIVGTAAGIVVGLLFAPAPGAQTRRRLADEANRVADVARRVAERAEHAAETIGSRMDHYLGRDAEIAWRKVHELREGVQRYSCTVMTS
jgi:gas vesicle protein